LLILCHPGFRFTLANDMNHVHQVLMMFGTDEQKRKWLQPLLAGIQLPFLHTIAPKRLALCSEVLRVDIRAGDIRSCFLMTEPDVASSDATNIETDIRREGDWCCPA